MVKDYHGSMPIQILWTGGWDSTFQLLQLLTVHKQSVTPFYFIDEERRSTGVEIFTMKSIKDQLSDQFPDTRNLLNPTRFFSVIDISPNLEISGAFDRVRNQTYIGSQYDWLARFCEEHQVTNFQLCIHQDDKAHAVIHQMVKENRMDGCRSFQLDESFASTDEYALFKYFSFPILNLTKLEMRRIAKEQGLEKIMGMTWFCHNPQKGMRPCGTCKPCVYTIEEGFGWRIPPSRRIQVRFERLIIRPSKAVTKKVLNRNPSE